MLRVPGSGPHTTSAHLQTFRFMTSSASSLVGISEAGWRSPVAPRLQHGLQSGAESHLQYCLMSVPGFRHAAQAQGDGA